MDAAGAVGAEDAGGVGFVDHEHGVVFGGELGDFGEGGEVAVHAVEGFDEDEAFVAVGGVLLEAAVEVGGVVVLKADELGAGELGAVDHAGVDEAVGEDEVVAVDEVGDGAEACEVAGAVEEGGGVGFVLGEAVFELFVEGEGAADEAGGGGSGAVLFEGGAGAVDEVGVVGEVEVVVAGEVEDAFAVGLYDAAGLGVGGCGAREVVCGGLVEMGLDPIFVHVNRVG